VIAISSLLFVPGSRPDRFAKAGDSGADLVIIDLEDAVADTDKGTARDSACAHVAAGNIAGWAIRINGVKTLAGLTDLVALGSAPELPAVLAVPMVESAVELDIVAAALGDRCPPLLPLIETPKGLTQAMTIAAHPAVGALMLGGADFCGELGVPMTADALAHARGVIAAATAAARIIAVDVPYLNLEDVDGLTAETALARRIGFAAKAAIHPAQIAAINAVMRPTAAQVAEAEAALAAYEAGGRRAIRYQGRMLEAPVIRMFEAVIARGKGKS
jgi:citrate lyase subunit beta/citryl-CoA lyase/(S)-citramalyl-CoA lyase